MIIWPPRHVARWDHRKKILHNYCRENSSDTDGTGFICKVLILELFRVLVLVWVTCGLASKSHPNKVEFLSLFKAELNLKDSTIINNYQFKKKDENTLHVITRHPLRLQTTNS